jgi:hypothetical protein
MATHHRVVACNKCPQKMHSPHESNRLHRLALCACGTVWWGGMVVSRMGVALSRDGQTRVTCCGPFDGEAEHAREIGKVGGECVARHVVGDHLPHIGWGHCSVCAFALENWVDYNMSIATMERAHTWANAGRRCAAIVHNCMCSSVPTIPHKLFGPILNGPSAPGTKR